MYLNDLNSSRHNVEKLNRILADTFKHDVDLSEMTTDSLNRMLNTTNAKMISIKESDLKYWENPQYNKLGLIQHQLKTYITEIAPNRADSKRVKTKESTIMEADLDQAEVLLAAQELVDEMQKMVENVAEMQVQKLMPIVDAMKEQVGFEVAEAYNSAADGALGALLDQMKTAKESVENATLAARGEPVPGGQSTPTDMGMDDAAMDPEAPMDADMGADEFGGDDAAAGEENPVGRELKGESALANMERGALAEKKFLESKDKLFKMVESGQMSQTDFINVINELDEGWWDNAKAGGKIVGGGIAKGLGALFTRGGDKDRSGQDGGFSDRLGRGLTDIGNNAVSSGYDTIKQSYKDAMKPRDRRVKEAPGDELAGGIQKLPGKMTPKMKAYLKSLGYSVSAIDGQSGPLDDPTTKLPQIAKPMGGYSNDPDARRRQGGGEIPMKPGDRGFTPGAPEPGYEPGRRGFTPGAPEPGYEPGRRGFTPGKQTPPNKPKRKLGVPDAIGPVTTPKRKLGVPDAIGPVTTPKPATRPAPLDGGIAPGTTAGGPSKLRQRQMAKQANDKFLQGRLAKRNANSGVGSTNVAPTAPTPRPAPLDGGIPVGTTAGGKSKLRQRLGK